MKRVIIAIFCLIIGTNVFADELGAANVKQIESAGIQVYPGAMFINGNKEIGFRFATDKSAEDVRAWYSKQLPKWSTYKEFGGWILYHGKPGLGIGDLMTIDQVSIQKNPKLQEWFGVEPGLSTEIVIMIPEQ